MQQESPATVTREPADMEPGHRRMRFVPPAVTPLRASDIAAGVVGHRRDRGRDRFRSAVQSSLDGVGSATYTSFRRTLGACLFELSRHGADDRETVAIPAFCSSDFADAVEGVGLEVARYDVDPETLAADQVSVERVLDEEPLALVAVNVLGYGSPMDDLAARCAERDTYLVEALGYALGTEYEGQSLGTFGDCAVLNFQQGKPIPVGGGMVVNQNAELSFDDDRSAVSPNAGALAGYAAFSHPRPYYAYIRFRDLLDEIGVSVPDTTHPEHKFDVAYAEPFQTLSNFQGTVGHRVFDRLDDHRKRRRRTAMYYSSELSDVTGVQHVTPVSGLDALQYVRYPILLETEALRDRIQTALADVGIQATTLYDWPVIDPDTFPGAARLQRSILTLPTHPYVDDRDRRQVVDVIRAQATDHFPLP